MASSMVVMVFAVALLIGCTNLAVAYGETAATGLIHVGGKVLCQDCSQGYNEWVNGAKPLKGVKVSLTCMDERRRVMCYKSDVTDEVGQFDMSVESYINGKKLKAEWCWVRLVSSPEPACNVLTDFGGGKSGVKLIRATSVYRDMITYTAGPFYYTTPMCEKPDTNNDKDESEEDQGSNY